MSSLPDGRDRWSEPDDDGRALVARQIGRPPREPWRVHACCPLGFPAVIASPSTLEDGSYFPTLYWLTCPWLSEKVAELESAGAADRWAARVSADSDLAAALRTADAELRAVRAGESGGDDACADVGLAGQRDALGVKCLHAHVALALAGVGDPVGQDTLTRVGYPCDDERCARLERGNE